MQAEWDLASQSRKVSQMTFKSPRQSFTKLMIGSSVVPYQLQMCPLPADGYWVLIHDLQKLPLLHVLHGSDLCVSFQAQHLLQHRWGQHVKQTAVWVGLFRA